MANVTQNKFFKDISEAKLKARQLLEFQMEEYSHFPIFEFYPDFEPRKNKGWHYTYPSPFLHANVMYALLNAGYTPEDPLIIKAKKFLIKTKESGDLWRFWNVKESEHPIPTGVDDTVVSSLVLKKVGERLQNAKILSDNIRPDGSILTWIKPSWKMLFMFPRVYFNLRIKDKNAQGALAFGMFSYQDSEPATAANVLAYLGDNEKTSRMAIYIGNVWQHKNQANYQFYDQPVIVAFHCARAFNEGVKSIEGIKVTIERYVEANMDTFAFAELLMAYLTISYFNGTEDLLVKLKSMILEEVWKRDTFNDYYPYVTSKDRVYFGGGPCWTAALFLEASKNW